MIILPYAFIPNRLADPFSPGLVEGGLINLKPLVTHRFTLENAVEAFETAVDVSRGGERHLAHLDVVSSLTCLEVGSNQVPDPR